MNGTMMEVSIGYHRNIQEERIPGRGLKRAVRVKWRISEKGMELGEFKGEATEFSH